MRKAESTDLGVCGCPEVPLCPLPSPPDPLQTHPTLQNRWVKWTAGCGNSSAPGRAGGRMQDEQVGGGPPALCKEESPDSQHLPVPVVSGIPRGPVSAQPDASGRGAGRQVGSPAWRAGVAAAAPRAGHTSSEGTPCGYRDRRRERGEGSQSAAVSVPPARGPSSPRDGSTLPPRFAGAEGGQPQTS